MKGEAFSVPPPPPLIICIDGSPVSPLSLALFPVNDSLHFTLREAKGKPFGLSPVKSEEIDPGERKEV